MLARGTKSNSIIDALFEVIPTVAFSAASPGHAPPPALIALLFGPLASAAFPEDKIIPSWKGKSTPLP